MILYYTGASKNNEPQINADKSLGGYVSSTPIPNGRLSNLFSLISKSDVLEQRKEIRMIALKNITGGALTNVTIHTNVTGSSVKLKIAAVAPFINSCNEAVFESVIDGRALPYQATLAEHEGLVNAITIASIANNEIIGIWLQREIETTSFPDLLPTTTLTTAQLAALLAATTQVKEENIELVINY